METEELNKATRALFNPGSVHIEVEDGVYVAECAVHQVKLSHLNHYQALTGAEDLLLEVTPLGLVKMTLVGVPVQGGQDHA